MPRASTVKRQQQGAASTRDTKHENGLVGPGKRIIKEKSKTDIGGAGAPTDGNPKPPAHAHRPSSSAADNNNNAAAPSPLPSPLPTSTAATNGFAKHNHSSTSTSTTTTDHMAPDLLARRPSVGTYSETSSSSLLSVSAAASGQPAVEDGYRRIDVNAAKNNNVHRDTGPFDFALTVLRSCPLHDTIAILIILMQLSPAALSSIYMLFTLLTFVPPVTTSSGLSLTEFVDGQGAPNLWTLVGLDVFFLILFAFMPLQDLILDFAQVVIALTLGGGASSRAGTTHNIFLCTGIVIFNHFGRHPSLKGYSNLRALFGGSWGSPDADDPLESLAGAFERKGPKGLFRSVLAIHILVQGLVRYVRDWYLRREKRDLLSQSQADPEAAKTPTFAGDTTTDGGYTPTDTETNRQLSNSTISTKKKRKQSAQVRIRQPLWAALASTKIVMVKEYELSHAASESAGSNATDIHNLGNAPFNTQPEQIWICYVGCDEVCFNTSYFPDLPTTETADENADGKGPAYVDTSKPFYVRVNNAVWQPTRIMAVDSGEEEGGSGTRWTGDIYGLTPMSNYECEFVSSLTGEVIFSTSIRTIQAKTKDSDAAKPAAPRTQYRHESPATTLKTSIAGLEIRLNEEKARLKALRKENNRKANAVKKDIDRLTSAVQSAGGNDDRLRQKIAQNATQQKQAEQSISDLEQQLKELETIPEDVLADYRRKQGEYSSEKSQFDGARAAFKRFKSSIDRETKALEEEHTSLQAKRTKIAARLNKVDNEHARITDANARGLDEAERRQQSRDAFVGECERLERDFQERLGAAQHQNLEKEQEALSLATTLQCHINKFGQAAGQADPVAFDEQQYASAYGAGGAVGPVQWPQYTGNSVWSPAASVALPASSLNSLANTPMPSLFSHNSFPQYQQHALPLQKSRGRSSSMLSDISGFTQSTNDGEDYFNGNGSNGSNSSNHYYNVSTTAGNSTINVNAPPFQVPTQPLGLNPFYRSYAAGGGLRSPPGIPFPQPRQTSDGGSGSGSGSGSSEGSGSVKDPTSPV